MSLVCQETIYMYMLSHNNGKECSSILKVCKKCVTKKFFLLCSHSVLTYISQIIKQ